MKYLKFFNRENRRNVLLGLGQEPSSLYILFSRYTIYHLFSFILY